MPRKSKPMSISAAIAEARRWLAYLDAQETKARQLAEIASARRAGTMTEVEGRRAVDMVQNRMGLTVYDGSLLAEAVKALIVQAEGK